MNAQVRYYANKSDDGNFEKVHPSRYFNYVLVVGVIWGGGNMSMFTHVDIIAATNCIIRKVNVALYRKQALQNRISCIVFLVLLTESIIIVT